jgi:hypothetical protein
MVIRIYETAVDQTEIAIAKFVWQQYNLHDLYGDNYEIQSYLCHSCSGLHAF